jgi:hypothetical protein
MREILDFNEEMCFGTIQSGKAMQVATAQIVSGAMVRPTSRDSNSRKKFTPAEDALLTRLVGQFGQLGWDVIAGWMPGRNPRQCRERWKHYLSVGFADEPWTRVEDSLLLEKQREMGPRWTKMASFFHNRSDIQLKARWIKLTERQRKAAGTDIRSHESPPAGVEMMDETPFMDIESGYDPGGDWGSTWRADASFL